MSKTTHDSWNRTRRLLTAAILLLAGPTLIQADSEPGVQVPPEFEVTRFADDELAHDIFSMTVDSFGRVVVSGPGYIKILIDEDGDGKADVAKTYAAGPKSGAQGMYFIGNDLLCAGDEGLVRYRDRDGDDQADGPPDVFLKIKTGNEHDLHAIRKGPDGWWYLITGNTAGVTESYISLPTSPVKKPEAGTLLRLSPDLRQGEVYAHGIRNAYDFDFNEAGDLFTFDSDEERELSLPWYRPTRVFQMTPGSHLGWVSHSWKRPDHFFDMPPVLGSFDRGSPTGVVCYRHTQFPAKYQGALFVLDWTFGQVFALPMQENGSTWKTEPIRFMTAIGQNGFAPTGAAVGPDGSLYVCTGGRGTRGTVYRIRAKESSSTAATFGHPRPQTPADKLNACLSAPQPLSSWSRQVWEPLAVELTSAPFIKAALDRSRTPAERVRAIEILTEKYRGVDGDLANQLSQDPSPLVRARAAWSIGRSLSETPNVRFLAPYLADPHPLVARQSLEALSGADHETFEDLIQPIGQKLADHDPHVRQAGMRVLTRVTSKTLHQMAQAGFALDWAATSPVAAAYALRNPGFNAYSVDIGIRTLKGNHSVERKVEATRILQLGLGDVAPVSHNMLDIFEGYASKVDLSSKDQELDPLRIALHEIYPTGEELLDSEIERVIAMVQPASDVMLGKILSQITEESDPVSDIHRLIVAARIPVAPRLEQRQVIANALIRLDQKIAERNLRQDGSWGERVMELYEGLVQRDHHLPIAILEHPDFGRSSHIEFLSELPPERFHDAINAFVKQIQADPDYEWSQAIIYVLGESEEEVHRQLIRSQFEDFSLRNAVLDSLSSYPTEEDRPFFIAGLEFAPQEILQSCVQALAMLPPSDNAGENVALALTLRRLSEDSEEIMTRDQIAELLQRNLREDHGYVLGRRGDPQSEAIAAWMTAIQNRFPDEFQGRSGVEVESEEELKGMLANVNWEHGDAVRGQQLFQTRSCTQCHNSSSALGPDLTGVTGRFSREDLFIAIVLPDRDVSPRYQTTQVVTHEGKVITGLVVYDALDGLVLRDFRNQTYRMKPDEIEIRQTLKQSIMPSGLLKDCTPQDYADLYAYLKNLSAGTSTITAEAPAGRRE